MILRYNTSMLKETLKLGREAHEESRYKNFSYAEEKLEKLLKNPGVFCALAVADGRTVADGGAVGYFIGIVQQMWFSETKIGFDLSFYIKPQHRGGFQAVRLVRAFEAFCREQGCAEVILGSNGGVSTELARGLYTKLGYRESGFIAQKDVV